jgi:hypothetical protein
VELDAPRAEVHLLFEALAGVERARVHAAVAHRLRPRPRREQGVARVVVGDRHVDAEHGRADHVHAAHVAREVGGGVVAARAPAREPAEEQVALERAELAGAEALVGADVEVVRAAAPEQEVGVGRLPRHVDVVDRQRGERVVRVHVDDVAHRGVGHDELARVLFEPRERGEGVTGGELQREVRVRGVHPPHDTRRRVSRGGRRR